MKYTTLLLSILLLIACGQKQNINKIITHKELKMAMNLAAAGVHHSPKKVVNKALEAKEIEELLSKNDIRPLFIQDQIYGPLNGFYGPDNYRIEFVILNMQQDKSQPNKYFISGKNRHKKVVSNFEGSFTIDHVYQVADPNIKDTVFEVEDYTYDNYDQMYACTGIFELKEDSTQPYSGIFSGKMALDFGVKEDGQPELWFWSNKTPARSSGFLFEGNWMGYGSTKSKPFLFSKDLFMFANEILKDFSIGEREVEVNPKYRKLGWDNFWEMDEWWVERTSAEGGKEKKQVNSN